MQNENQENFKEVSLLELWSIFLNNILLVLTITFTFGILATIYTFFIVVPDYRSNADVMVQVAQDSSSSDTNFDLVNAFRLIDTVAELMEKQVILENALERLEKMGYSNLDVKYLRDGLSISSSSTSYFITINFVDENTELAKNVVDAVIDAVIEETDVADAFPVLTDKIRRTSYASDAEYNSPNRFTSIFLGSILGMTISLGIIFSKEFFNTGFRNKEEIENLFNNQVLAVIPNMVSKEKKNEKK